jgi:hypothetical protein
LTAAEQRSVRTHLSLLALAAAVGLGAGCRIDPPAWRRTSSIDLRYRLRQMASPERQATSTAVYRGLLARSLYSDCRMVPNDSASYNRNLERCGVVRAVIGGVSRLLLERAATPAFLHPVRKGERVRWIDLPAAAGCARSRWPAP